MQIKQVSIFLVWTRMSLLCGYQIDEPGVFFSHVSKTPVYQQKKQTLNLQKRADGTDSNVVVVNGVDEFKHFVIAASIFKPVIINVCVQAEPACQQMMLAFQQVADQLQDEVICTSLDLTQLNQEQPENRQILIHLFQNDQILGAQRPLFLFFQGGGLVIEQSTQQPLCIQGVRAPQDLVEVVKSAFIQAQVQQGPQTVQDLTVTTTGRGGEDKNILPALSGNQEKPSIWQRIKSWFKR